MNRPGPSSKQPQSSSSTTTDVEKVAFNDRTIEALIKLSFKNEKTKTSGDAISMMSELLKVHSLELLSRSAEQAKKEGSDLVKLEHLEKVLPQFMLDFC